MALPQMLPVRGSAIRTNIFANFGGQGWSALMGFAFTPVYVQLLGIESFALIGLFAMLQVWLTLLDLGIMPTAARELARLKAGAIPVEPVRDLLFSFELICLVLALAVALVLAASGTWIATKWLNLGSLSASTVADAIRLMGIVVSLRFVEALYRNCLTGFQRQVWLNSVSALLATLRNGGAVLILLWVERSISAYFVWNAAISAAGLALMALKVHGMLPHSSRSPRFSPEALLAIRGFAAGAFGINILALALMQSDKLLLARLLPLETYGYYMLASTVTGMLYTLSLPVTQAVYPAMIESVAGGRDAELRHVFHRAAQLLTAVAAPAALLLILFPERLLFAWSGDMAVAEAIAPLLRLIAAGTLLNLLMQMPYYLQLAHGWTSLTVRANLVAVTVFIPALLWLVPLYGARAAAWLWIAVNLFYLLLVAPIAFRKLFRDEFWRWLGADVLAPLSAAFIALLIAAAFAPPASSDRLVQGAFTLVAGVAAACLSFLTIRGSVATLRALLGFIPTPRH